MARDDSSMQNSSMPAFDDQGNEVHREDLREEDRDLLGLDNYDNDVM